MPITGPHRTEAYGFRIKCKDCGRMLGDDELLLIGNSLKCMYDRNQYFVLIPFEENIPPQYKIQWKKFVDSLKKP